MNALRAQYFLAFAVMGALLPFLPVYLSDRGLTVVQIGWVQAMGGLAVLVSPVVMALAADMHISSRRLLRIVFVGCGVSLWVMAGAESFVMLAVMYAVSSLALAPVTSLQDGLNFAEQDRRLAMGQVRVAYHRIRVFGTLGFIGPSVLLYLLLSQGMSTTVTIIVAVGLCAAGMMNTFVLPQPSGLLTSGGACGGSGLPTFAAVKAMLEPHMLVFCAAMWVCQLGVGAYYAFYPLYLTQTIGLDAKWVGLIASIGVTIEIVFMLGFGFLLRKLGVRGLMTLGVIATAGRLLLLGVYPTLWVAIGTQLLHGLMVLVVHVVPPIFLNQRADTHYRHSLLGLYVMIVYGTGRLVGVAAAGYIAERSLTAVFEIAAVLCAVSGAMFIFAFREPSSGGVSHVSRSSE